MLTAAGLLMTEMAEPPDAGIFQMPGFPASATTK
jgi:hypothetical protein